MAFGNMTEVSTNQMIKYQLLQGWFDQISD